MMTVTVVHVWAPWLASEQRWAAAAVSGVTTVPADAPGRVPPLTSVRAGRVATTTVVGVPVVVAVTGVADERPSGGGGLTGVVTSAPDWRWATDAVTSAPAMTVGTSRRVAMTGVMSVRCSVVMMTVTVVATAVGSATTVAAPAPAAPAMGVGARPSGPRRDDDLRPIPAGAPVVAAATDAATSARAGRVVTTVRDGDGGGYRGGSADDRGGYGRRDERDRDRPDREPIKRLPIPDDVTGDEIDKDVRQELQSLPKGLAEDVSRTSSWSPV